MQETDIDGLEECYTPEEVAKILKVSKASVYRNKWALGAIKVGKSVRFPRNFLEVLVADSKEEQREMALRYEAHKRAKSQSALQQRERFKDAARLKRRGVVTAGEYADPHGVFGEQKKSRHGV